MMERCPHVRQMSICCKQSSVLNPRNWSCNDCGTTESVWACLTCSHFACGRSANGHAIKHFDITHHSLAIEVNNKYVHCYECDDWILNDTSTNDIQLIQSLLQQVASQSYQESRTRSGRVIRPAAPSFMRLESKLEQAQSHSADKIYTALCHYKFLVLTRTFNCWKQFVKLSKINHSSITPPSASSYRKLITPGMTGLRNLGNTCYMNAALQALGHLQFLRETFRQMGQSSSRYKSSSSTGSILFNRQTTIECFQHMSAKPHPPKGRLIKQSGLNEGERNKTSVTNEELGSLCEEMHGLMRVMWSGKWAVVTPHTILTAIWHHIPSFRGYCQQDAQEFLCELLDQLQSELLQCPSEQTITITNPSHDVVPARELLRTLFEGQLTSTIIYNKCKHSSVVNEPFWDLSLEFPERLMETLGRRMSCSLAETISHFTSTEYINEEIFECSQCPNQLQSVAKQLIISYPPEVLRLHLKRFRYSHPTWQKINSTIIFPMALDIQSYCNHGNGTIGVLNTSDDYIYDLTSVIVHHGSGFISGHYTSYCWNNDAGSWVHCNDARLSRTTPDEVLKAQAYVLFYARRTGRSPVQNRTNPSTQPPSLKCSRKH